VPDAIIVLAAGASRRFGSPKQLASWRDRPLVRFVAEEALATGATVLVVTGSANADVQAALEGLPVRVVFAAR
jgi:molybdenum cofactor cytidylyltransferase